MARVYRWNEMLFIISCIVLPTIVIVFYCFLIISLGVVIFRFCRKILRESPYRTIQNQVHDEGVLRQQREEHCDVPFGDSFESTTGGKETEKTVHESTSTGIEHLNNKSNFPYDGDEDWAEEEEDEEEELIEGEPIDYVYLKHPEAKNNKRVGKIIGEFSNIL